MNCCICGVKIEKDYGNNPSPIKKKGLCCDMCNIKFVIPRRIELAIGSRRQQA